MKYQTIHVWWLSCGIASKKKIHELNHWFTFWHFHYPPWGNMLKLWTPPHSYWLFICCSFFHTFLCFKVAFEVLTIHFSKCNIQIFFLQTMDLQEDASMPTSNLVIDFYDTIIDDFIRTFLQHTWYRDYLIGRSKGHGPNNYELHLQVSNWSCDLQKMVEALSNIAFSSSLQSKLVGLGREQRFRTCKQKFRNPLSFAKDSHWRYQDNWYVPHWRGLMFHDSSQ
jgi:hypothetical protein